MRNGLIYFIYNPWFEPVFPEDDYRTPDTDESVPFTHSIYKFSGAGPYWFGNNSVRGVLAETVAKLLEEAKLPSTEPAQVPWFGEDRKGKTDLEAPEMQKLTMEEFISTTISSEDRWCSSRPPSICDIMEESHITPWVEWEILHPQLPILKITAHADQTLPLAPAGLEKIWQDDRISIKPRYSRNMSTKYSVSFVISLQNRWASFDDPNRWIIRFKDGTLLHKTLGAGPGAALPQLLGRHRLHAAPDHRPGGADGPRIREEGWSDTRPEARQLQPSTQHRPLGGPRTHPDRRAEADLQERIFLQWCRKPRRAGLTGMAEPEHTQRRVPAPGACAHGAQAGTGDEGVEEVRDGGLRLVGSTLPTPTVRLRSETPAKEYGEYGESAAPRCPEPPSAEFHLRSSSAGNISALLLPKPTPWTGCRPVRMAVIIAVTQLNQSAAPPTGAGPREAMKLPIVQQKPMRTRMPLRKERYQPTNRKAGDLR